MCETACSGNAKAESVAEAGAARGLRPLPFLLTSLVLILVLFGACKGDDGAVFIRFTHGSDFYFFMYSDPNLPAQIWTFQTYQTRPGNYYVEWTYDDATPPYWYANYRIKADKGGAFWSDGDDRTFEFFMGRGFYEFDRLSAESVQPVPVKGSRGQAGDGLEIDETQARVVGSYTQRVEGYTLEVTVFEQRHPKSEREEE